MEVLKDKLRFFRSSTELRRWLEKNHDKAQVLWIGFHRKDSGKGGITYAQALDEALCYGWIDGIRKKLDDSSFTIRFTPRKKSSIWSRVNIGHIERLTREGRMMPSGTAAYEAKDESKSGIYSFERGPAELPPEMQERFRKRARAWKYFQSQPPYYRKIATWYVIGAKRDDTREKRLSSLIDHSAREMRLPQFTPASTSKKKK